MLPEVIEGKPENLTFDALRKGAAAMRERARVARTAILPTVVERAAVGYTFAIAEQVGASPMAVSRLLRMIERAEPEFAPQEHRCCSGPTSATTENYGWERSFIVSVLLTIVAAAILCFIYAWIFKLLWSFTIGLFLLWPSRMIVKTMPITDDEEFAADHPWRIHLAAFSFKAGNIVNAIALWALVLLLLKALSARWPTAILWSWLYVGSFVVFLSSFVNAWGLNSRYNSLLISVARRNISVALSAWSARSASGRGARPDFR